MTRSGKAAQPRFPEHSPTVAGRWLATDIRRLRLKAGLKQIDVARELRCTNTKIGHLETGHTPVRRTDLLVMLPLFGVPDERRSWYLDLCDKARQKGWWDGTDGVPAWFSLFLGLEWGADRIFSYDLGTIPGLLQTREYASAVIASGFPDDPEHADQVIEQRLQRQQALQRATDPLAVHTIIDEAVLHRHVGAGEVMRSQLKHLVAIADHPQVTLQVMPYSAGPHSGHLGTFTVLDFPSVDDPGVVYLETRCGGLYLEENDELGEFRRVSSEVANLALDTNKTKAFLKKLTRSWT